MVARPRDEKRPGPSQGGTGPLSCVCSVRQLQPLVLPQPSQT